MIYLDYVATTPLNEDIKKSYFELLNRYFANSDSQYKLGYDVDRLLEKSRQKIADMMGVNAQEIIFTSSGSEANNLAIKGTCFKYQNRGKHIITSCIEHSSVYNTFCQLRDVFHFDVDFISVDTYGYVNLEELESKIREDTILVSLMHVNNEVGTIQPYQKISSLIKKKNSKTKFHVDFVQSLGKLPLDLSYVDLGSFSAHKIYGLKGSGFLYKNKHTDIIPLISAGQQEFGLRGGSENACTNIVLAKTLRLALENQEAHYQYLIKLHNYFIEKLNMIDDIIINSPIDGIKTLVNISLPHYKSEVIVHELETHNIYISTKSACSSKEIYSRILENMHLSHEIVQSALRISLSYQTSYKDIDTFIYVLKQSLKIIRKEK